MRKICAMLLMMVLLAGCSSDLPAIKETVQKAQASVVLVSVTYKDGSTAYGSGFLIAPNLIATAAHGVKSVRSVTATTIDGVAHEVDVATIKTDQADVAVFMVEMQASVIPFADKEAETGDWVIASGYADGLAAPRYTCAGLVFLTNAVSPAYPNASSASIPGYPGMSGSPVVNTKGQLVGMVVAGAIIEGSVAATPTVFIPLSVLKPTIEKLTK